MLRDALRDRRIANYILYPVLHEEFFQYMQARCRRVPDPPSCTLPSLRHMGSDAALAACLATSPVGVCMRRSCISIVSVVTLSGSCSPPHPALKLMCNTSRTMCAAV